MKTLALIATLVALGGCHFLAERPGLAVALIAFGAAASAERSEAAPSAAQKSSPGRPDCASNPKSCQ